MVPRAVGPKHEEGKKRKPYRGKDKEENKRNEMKRKKTKSKLQGARREKETKKA